MRSLFISLTFILVVTMANAQQIAFEKDNNTTATYAEVIFFYKELDQRYDQMKMLEYGPSDAGYPLHLVVLSKDKVFEPARIRQAGKRVLLINNGIHPGEPEGIDASMLMVRKFLQDDSLPKDLVICIVPVYNIGGMLNRGTSRVNQNGPAAYGFRGNSQNLDLNRDFIKGDSQNSTSFQQLFNVWNPEVFIDNHTSNGADYQYVITIIPTQKDKLHPVLSEYLNSRMLPDLYSGMKSAGFEMTPYVNSVEESPDAGITGFLESPRYSTGYAALHNTIGFMPETHMLKPFDQRVASTYQFMLNVIRITVRDGETISANRKKADMEVAVQESFPLEWKLDRNSFTTFNFKGFEAKKKPSDISGMDRLYYDRKAPFEKEIKVWDKYVPVVTVQKPRAYIIPQSWKKVIGLFELNGVVMKRLAADTEIDAEMYYIEDYKTSPRPYEGHYLHSQTRLAPRKQKIRFLKGDYVVSTDQPKNRYIVETLEPQATDSFFAWNFFDSVLGTKEHFSAYVFEDEAFKLLQDDPGLKSRFEAARNADPEMSKSAQAQLNWIYKNSKYYEPTYLRYPIGRYMGEIKFSVK